MRRTQELARLAEFADDARDLRAAEYGGRAGMSLRYGRLNILAFIKPDQFYAWQDATADLVARKPVTRDEAIRTIERFEELYISKEEAA